MDRVASAIANIYLGIGKWESKNYSDYLGINRKNTENPKDRMRKIIKRRMVGIDERFFEEIVIITNPSREKIADKIFNAILQYKDDKDENPKPEITKLVISPRLPGDRANNVVAHAVQGATAIITVTESKQGHVGKNTMLKNKMVRIIGMPGINDEMFSRIPSKPKKISQIVKKSEKIANLLSQAKKVRITTEAGTDVSIDINGKSGIADTGLCWNLGDYTNLPAGEAFIPPKEFSKKSSGRVVVDGSVELPIYGPQVLRGETIEFEMKESRIIEDSITGGEVAQKYKEILLKWRDLGDETNMVLGELGIGTNEFAKLSGSVLEDEKVEGTFHLAFGHNDFFGGKIKDKTIKSGKKCLHLDLVMKYPDIQYFT
jgi:leucyl aminopeptidase (aminopeptidase T)